MFKRTKRVLAMIMAVLMIFTAMPMDTLASSLSEQNFSGQVEQKETENVENIVIETHDSLKTDTEVIESEEDIIAEESVTNEIPDAEVIVEENSTDNDISEEVLEETSEEIPDFTDELISSDKEILKEQEQYSVDKTEELESAPEEREIVEKNELKHFLMASEVGDELLPERESIQLFSSEDIVYGDENGITRAEWLHNLISVFALSVTSENFPDSYYPDVQEEHEYYYDILSAIEHGLVNVEAGSNFEPDAAATRDFVVSTLNKYLGIQLEESSYTFSDSSECTDPASAQIALDRGWMSLVDGKFVPSQQVSSSEVTTMIQDAKTLFSDTIVDEDYNSQYVFADYVVVFPESTSVVVDEETVTITEPTETLEVGDTFVVWPTSLPCIYLAENVTVTENGIVVTTAEADVDAALLDVDASGSVEVDLSNFEGADGFEINYVETQAEAASLVQAYGISVTKNSVVASKDFTIGDGLDVSFVCNLSDLKFNHNILSKNNFYVSVTGNYSVSSSVTLDAIAAANGSSSIVIGYATVAGIGKVTISVELALEGEITYTYSGYFEAGVQKSGSAISLKRSFQKTGFTCDIEVNASVGIKVEFAIDVFVAKGSVFASTGISAKFVSHDFNDGTLPNNCSNLSGWWYVKVGAKATLGIKPLAKDFGETIDIYDAKNSPVKLNFHFEDGQKVYSCTRGSQKYFTYADSRYGSSSYLGGSSTGVGSDGNTYTIYTYSLDEDNNATITGYKGNASAISIPNTIDGYTVTAIGSGAFKENTQIRVVTLPNTIVLIDTGAFESCINLKSVYIPDCVTSIGCYAFGKCSTLSNIKLPRDLNTLGSSAFYNCDGLTGINIPANITNIPSTQNYDYPWMTYGKVFSNCDNLKNISFDKGITTIPKVFNSCASIEEIVVPDTVTDISGEAFESCTSLKKVVLPDALTTIGSSVFGNCINLSQINLPSNLTTIGSSAFYNCDSLEEIDIPAKIVNIPSTQNYDYPNMTNGKVFAQCNNLKTVTFLSGRTNIPKMLNECTFIENVVIPDSVTAISSGAFEGCTGLKKIDLPKSLTSIGSSAFGNCVNLREIILPSRLSTLGSSAFHNCDSLESINIPASLNNIPSTQNYEYPWMTNGKVFAQCDNLKEVIFEKDTKIILKIFNDCPSIKTVKIPNSVTEIVQGAFGGCSSLTNIEIPSSVTKIGDNAFYYCTSLSEIIIPDTVTTIGVDLFKECTSLTKVKLPDSITSIPNNTFYNCKMLERYDLPENITIIGNSAFSNCINLKEFVWNSKIESIKSSAFNNCDSLEEVILPNTVKSLGNNVFYDCDGLKKVIIPNMVTSFGSSIFYDCDALTDIAIGNGISSIPTSTFEHCDVLESIVLPYGVTSIGANAFKNSTKLTTIIIPRATTSIDSTAFSYPDKLTIYGVAGTYAETFANENDITFINRSIPATKVELDKSELILNDNTSSVIRMTVTPFDFTDEVVWKSTDTNVVTISQDGTVDAVGTGTATIKLTVGEISKSCKVTVVQPVTYIDLNTYGLELDCGETYQLIYEIEPWDAYNKEVIWSSSDENIATVEKGLVTAKKKGNANITVTAQDGSECSNWCSVYVKNNAYEIINTDNFESSHPYADNCTDSWVYKAENAEQISLTFSTETMFEEDFDFLYIYDENDDLIGKYTGNQLAGQTITVNGTKIKIKLSTDSSGSEYGFKVDNIFANKGQKVSVTFDSQGGTNVETITGLKIGSTVTIPEAPTRKGYVFKGWYTKPEGQGDKIINSIVVKEDITVYAAWEKIITYTVIFDSQGGERVENIENILPGTIINLPRITIDSDLHFSGWYTEPNGQGDFYFESLTIDSDITLYAYWTENPTYEGYMVEVILDQVYTGKALKPEIKVYDNSILLTLGQDYTLSYKNNTKVGTAQVIVKGKGNYTKTMTIEFEIVPKSLADDDILITCADKLYNGKKQVSKPTIKWGKKTLKNGTDYTVTYSADQISVGVVTVTIEGKGNYGGSVETSYRITDKDISKVLMEKIPTQYYTGAEIEPEILLYADKATKAAGEALVLDSDYGLVYDNNINAGKGTVTITGLGEYGGSKTVTFTISKQNVSSEGIDVTASTGESISEFNVTYNGKAQKPEIVIYDNGLVLEEGKDYKLSYSNTTNAATVDSKTKPTITITGMGNYTGTKKVFFNILPQNIETSEGFEVTVADAKYTGKEVKPKVTVTYAGKTLKSGTDYKVTGYYNNIDLAEKDSANAPYVTIEGIKNFTGTVDVNFRIYEQVASGLVVDKIAPQIYTPHDAIEPEVFVYASKAMQTEGNALVEGVDYEITSYETNKKVGTGKVTVTGLGQYGGSKAVAFTISKRNLLTEGIFVEMLNKQMNYTGSALKPAFKVMDGDIELTEGVDYTVSYSNNKTVPKSSKTVPTITIKGKGNYTGTIKETFEILPKSLYAESIVITAKDVLLNQKTANSTKGMTTTVTVMDGSKKLSTSDYKIVEYKNNRAAGDATDEDAPTVVIEGKGNYTGTVEIPFRIFKNNISKAVVAKIPNELYTGKVIEPKPVVTLKLSKTETITLVEGEDYIVSYDKNVQIGKAKVIITGIGEYGGSKNVSFTILPKWLKWFL